ncbi:hypothetical protein [Parendozoicomonas sp. Alg238-R29]|uniref:hypothetical protein n=1 Tax=Parendozoicomonas sp. Alg238-R29 TaxID=2993446 RepID=UPI00248F09BF|nr:hypothetical protein [Parendozoicomonas sp. Alg238-R29]
MVQARLWFLGILFCFTACLTGLGLSDEFVGFDLMQPRVEYGLGDLQVGDDTFELVIVYLPSLRFGDNSFYSIHCKQGHEKVGVITFVRESTRLLFQGIIINEKMRNLGLSKPFLKAFFSFGLAMGYRLETTKCQRKPLVNLQLQKFGFSPDSQKRSCFVDTEKHEDQKLHVYPVGCTFANKTISSQNLLILKNIPKNFVSVPVFTSFSQPVNDDLERILASMPGTPQLVNGVHQKP